MLIDRNISAARPPSSKFWFWMAPDPTPVKIEAIKRAVCDYFCISCSDLLSDRLDQDSVYPRHIGMYLAKSLGNKSYQEIAERFNRSNHTTVMSAFLKVERLVKTDSSVAYDIAQIREKLS